MQPSGSSVHVDAPLGSRKYPVKKKLENLNPKVNNQDVDLADWAIDADELEDVAKSDLNGTDEALTGDGQGANPPLAAVDDYFPPEDESIPLPRRVATVGIMHGNHLLMGKRRDNGLWTCPGGHMDPGEDYFTGALREVEEETGLRLIPIQMQALSDTHQLVDKEGLPLHVQPFVVQLSERPATSMKQDPDGEVERWRWVDTTNGIPPEMAEQMHTPLNRNVLMQELGFAPETEEDLGTEDEEEPDEGEGIRLDLGSGQSREKDCIGIDTYPYDENTLVHDLHLGLPFEDGSVEYVRMANTLHEMDDKSAILDEIHRVLKPGGEFHYEGADELSEYPEGLEKVEHLEGVTKSDGQPEWHIQRFERPANPDAATSDDTEPRLRLPPNDLLPSDAILAMDAVDFNWSDATSSGQGNRRHGYPSQGALIEKGGPGSGPRKGGGSGGEEKKEPDKKPAIWGPMRGGGHVTDAKISGFLEGGRADAMHTHERLSSAHREEAKAAESAGRKSDANHHNKMASYHEARASQHHYASPDLARNGDKASEHYVSERPLVKSPGGKYFTLSGGNGLTDKAKRSMGDWKEPVKKSAALPKELVVKIGMMNRAKNCKAKQQSL